METSLEHLLISSHKDEMIVYMVAHPEDFEEAIKLAISNKQPYSWRSAWLLWSCMEENDQRVQGYIKDIIDTLTTKNEDHQRELIKILQQMELSDEYEGFLFDVCVTIWKKIDYEITICHFYFDYNYCIFCTWTNKKTNTYELKSSYTKS